MSKQVFTVGRPPWYDETGSNVRPFVIGVAGGTASGKTTVCNAVLRRLNVQWVVTMSTDSFYLPLTEEQRKNVANYNFDHPNAFDFDLLVETIQQLRDCKQVNVPNYNFVTHSRDGFSTVYGADVIIVEGIMALYHEPVRELFDMKIFVDTDSDSRLARRIRRDIAERGRTVDSVLTQYERFVKPAFDEFVKPTARHADIVVPRGADNYVAIELIAQHIATKLQQRAKRSPTPRISPNVGEPLPPSVIRLNNTNVVKVLITILRDQSLSRDDFISTADRLMHMVWHAAFSTLKYEEKTVVTPTETEFKGFSMQDICVVSVMRGGDALVGSLRKIVRTGCAFGQILIQSNEEKQPSLFYVKLPASVVDRPVFVCEPLLGTGQSLFMALRVLLDHGVKPEMIVAVTLFSTEVGLRSIYETFPSVKIVTVCADGELNSCGHIIPGCGNFGNRYFGTMGDPDLHQCC